MDAARMGRADARMNLGDWAGAVADAGAVPDQVGFELEYDNVDPIEDGNGVAFRQASDPWREWTVWGTFREQYYLDSGDPRAAWRDNLPFHVSLRFPSRLTTRRPST